MGPLVHLRPASCIKHYRYHPSFVVRFQRAASRKLRLLRPPHALPNSRAPQDPDSDIVAFLEQQGLTIQDLQALQREQEQAEVVDDYEESDDYYAVGRTKGVPNPAPAPPPSVEAAGGDEEAEADLEEELAEPEAAAQAEPEPEAVVEEAVVEVHTPTEYTEIEVEEEYQNFRLQDFVESGVRFFHNENLGRGIAFGAAAVVGASLGLALFRTWTKYTSARANRKRLVDKNKLLVEELGKYLPANQSKLTPAVARALKGKTGFTEVEIFRKFLWYALRERKFDQALIDDLAWLKAVLQLSDDDVAAALRERAQRVYDKYGSLMLNTAGMTAEGVERKATCKALFQKILYITECEALLPTGSLAAESVNLREIFGATEEDLQEARIVSLYDVDLEALDALASAATADAQAEEADEEKKKDDTIREEVASIPTPAPTPPASPEATTTPTLPATPSTPSTEAPTVSKSEYVFQDIDLSEPVKPAPTSEPSKAGLDNTPVVEAKEASKGDTASTPAIDASTPVTEMKPASSSSGGISESGSLSGSEAPSKGPSEQSGSSDKSS